MNKRRGGGGRGPLMLAMDGFINLIAELLHPLYAIGSSSTVVTGAYVSTTTHETN